jgi:hypothetical protein
MSSDYYADVSDPIVTDAGTFRVRVEYDLYDGLNPRTDFDQLGTMVCKSRQYDLPREGDLLPTLDTAYERGGWRLVARYLSAVHNAVVLPIYGDDRTVAGKLGDAVDDGARITGVIYVTRARINQEWTDQGFPAPPDEQIAQWLAVEVDQYATWANNEMTGYVIERRCECGECDGEWCDTGDSCWGYFSVADAMDDGREAVPTVRPVTDNERVITVSVSTRDGWEVVSRERVSPSSQAVGDVTVQGVRFGGMAGQRVLIELRDGNDQPLHCAKLLTTR